MLPFVPELDRSIDEILFIRACPQCVAIVSQQVTLLVCTHELAAVGRINMSGSHHQISHLARRIAGLRYTHCRP